MSNTAATILTLLAFYVVFLIWTGIPLFVIAYKSAHEWKWLAFVPIGNFWLMCDMADAEVWWIFLLLIPYLDVIFYALIWMRIAENTNKPSWLGLLMILPLVSVFVAYYMAFVDTGQFIA